MAALSLVCHCSCGGWCVRLPEVSCFPLPPIVPPTCVLVRWCVPFPEVLPSFVRRCLPTCVPLFGVFAFPPLVLPCLPLSTISPHMCACVGFGGCVCLPEVLPPFVSTVSPHACQCWMACLAPLCHHCLRSSFLFEGLSPLVSLCLPLSPMSLLASLCWKGCHVSQVLPVHIFYCFPHFPSHVMLCLCLCWIGCLIVHFSPSSVLLAVPNAFSCVLTMFLKTLLESTCGLGSTVV